MKYILINLAINIKKMKKQQKILSISVTPQEYAEILIKSADDGYNVSAYSRKKIFSNEIKALEKGGALKESTVLNDTDSKKSLENIKNLERELSEYKKKSLSQEKEISALKSSKNVNGIDSELINKLINLKENHLVTFVGCNIKNPYYDLIRQLSSEFNKIKK